MKSGYVLYLSDYQLQVYRVEGRRVVLSCRFTHDSDGHEAFAAYLRAAPFRKTAILVDTRSEEYRIDRIPHLLAGDRTAMLEHKKRRMFPATPYSFAVLQQSKENQGEGNKAGPAQDRVLFTCLNNPNLVRPWSQRLLAQQIAITRIASVPLLSPLLLKYLPVEDYTLLVTYTSQIGEHNPYGLRQSFFADQQLSLSRLSPMPGLDTAVYTDYVFTEVVKTQQYLQGNGFLPEEENLNVVMVVPPALLRPLQQHLAVRKSSLPIRYFLIDIGQLSQFINLEMDVEPGAGQPAEMFFSSLLVWHIRRTGRNHYGQAQELRYHIYHKIRQGLFAATALTGAGLLAYGGWILSEALAVRAQTAEHQTQTRQLEKRTQAQKLQNEELGFNIEVVHLKNTVDVAEYLETSYTDPRRSLVIFSQYLQDYPQIRLLSLEWESRQRPKPLKRRGGGLRNARVKVKREMEDIEVLSTDVNISRFEDMLDAKRTVKNFTGALEQEEAVESADVVQSPDSAAGKQLSGELGMQRERPKEMKFKLEVIFKFAENKEANEKE